MTISVTVSLGDRSYPVLVGRGAVRRLPEMVPAGVERVLVVTQPGVPLEAADVLRGAGLDVAVVEIGRGESAKTMATVQDILERLAVLGATRRDLVVGAGGGMVTDVAGFAASLWHRGIRVVHVATTLLAMVDAAVGGKTGVNLGHGKNLVGTFWQPSGVICDTAALDGLPEREVRCGQGEMAKYHFLTGDDLLALPIEERIARCVAIKATVVASDERESGRRAILNYGHTLAHALEIETNFGLAHGEAVAVGIAYAARLARRLGRIDDDRVREHLRVLHEYGLESVVPASADPERLLALMHGDKKALNGLTFVLDGPSGVEVVPGVDAGVAAEALADMAVR